MEKLHFTSILSQAQQLTARDNLSIAQNLHTQAEALLKSGQTQQSRTLLAEAYAMLPSLSKSELSSFSTLNFGMLTLTLAHSFEAEGQYHQADLFFHDALNFLLAEGKPQQQGQAYFAYGLALNKRGNYTAANYYLCRACEPFYRP